MSSFTVTTATLMNSSNELNDLNTRFKMSVEHLTGFEASLNGMWDGEANDAFHAAFMVDKSKMDEFYTLINQYVEKLRLIAERYNQVEEINTDIAATRTY